MQNVIERVSIEGFWGDKTVQMSLHSKYNFIIGLNGTGKTTFVELLSAILRVDFDTLVRIDFRKVEITLKTVGKNAKPKVVVEKTQINEFLQEITYSVSQNSSSPAKIYSFEDFADIRMMRRRRLSKTPTVDTSSLAATISELVNISWLPIIRARSSLQREESIGLSPIDHKMSELTNGFSRYFSLLQAISQRETDIFQEQIFLSLLFDSRRTERMMHAYSSPAENEAMLQREKAEIEEIFQEFSIGSKKYRKPVDDHFQAVEKAMQQRQEQRIEITDLVALLDNERVHSVVQIMARASE